MLSVSIKTIPHKFQRYNTCGDYVENKRKFIIRISEMPKQDYEVLIALHEFVEMYLCRKRGVSFKDIDKYDISFENSRQKGDKSEPGDDPNAPYYKEHQFSTAIEKLMAGELGVNWQEYEEAVNNL